MCAIGLCLVGLAAAGCSRTVVEAPPPPQEEVVAACPGPDYIWIGGYWDWSWGHYVWVGGRWERPAHVRAEWVRPRWEHRGDRYVLIKGYWR
ncbi:MAG: YXWGXW repeat-containing protein [Opitutaceae bacterium]